MIQTNIYGLHLYLLALAIDIRLGTIRGKLGGFHLRRDRRWSIAYSEELVSSKISATLQRTPEVLAGWKAWAAEHAKAFQRASSAVEGRNGYLSQMQHNHRGLPTRRYQVWTVLHNFDCRAADGTTPASRFFRRSFPDLFESVLSQIDELPMPRQRRQALAASN